MLVHFFQEALGIDSAVFGLPHATSYDAGTIHPVIQLEILMELLFIMNMKQELIIVKGGTTYAIPANILSGDFDITQDQKQGITFRGDGEFIMRVSRFLPDFITQSGNTIVELDLRNFPNQTAASSTLGPFTITSATNYQSCRARGQIGCSKNI